MTYQIHQVNVWGLEVQMLLQGYLKHLNQV